MKLRIVAGDEDGITAEAVAEMAFLALEFPVLKQRIGHGIVVDRQEEIRVKIVGGGDTLDKAGPGLALGQEQLRLGKAFDLQFLLDPLRKAQIEDELGDVAGAGGAFRHGGMSDIQHDAEFRAIAHCRDRFQWKRGGRPQGGKLYMRSLGEVASFLAGLSNLPCFDEPLKISDSRPACADPDRQKHQRDDRGDDGSAAWPNGKS